MAPKKVFVIRHCDKPDKNDTGLCNSNGFKRANLLAGISPYTQCDGQKELKITDCNNYCPLEVTKPYPYWGRLLLDDEKPTKLLAAVPKKLNKNCTTSNRCCLILNPTSAVYNLNINEKNESFCDTEGSMIADYIKKNYSSNDIVIVAWEHNNIPTLINEFNINPKLQDWPKKSNDRFDLVFEIDFSDNPSKPTLVIYTQNLNPNLPGDKNDDDPFDYKKQNNSLRNTQKYYDTNTSNQNNGCKKKKIIVIVVGIIVSIVLICILIFFIKKLSVKK